MAQFFTNWSSDTIGAAPVGWTRTWGTGTWAVAADTIRYVRGTVGANNWQLLTWDAPGSALTDSEIVVKVRASSQAGDAIHLWLRASGTSTARNGYYLGSNAGGAFDLLKSVGGTVTALGSSSGFAYSANVWFWVRFQASGTTVRCRAWADGTAEPATWNLTTTDSAITSGGIGIGFWYAPPSRDYAIVGVGTGTDSAPIAPVGGGPTPVTYTQTLSLVLTTSPTASKVVGKLASAVVSTGNTKVRGISKALAVVASTLNTTAKTAMLVRSATVSAATALVKTSQLVRSVTVATSTMASKAVAKAIAVAVSVTNTVSKGITTARTATITTTSAVVKSVGKPLTRAITTTSTTAKAFAKSLAVSVTTTRVVTKSVSVVRAVASTITTAITWTVGRVYTVTLTAVVSVTPSVAKGVGKVLARVVSTVTTATKNASVTHTVSVTSAGNIAKNVAKSFVASVSTATAVTRNTGKVALVALTALSSMAKGMQVRLATVVAVVPSVRRGMALTRIVAVQVTASLVSLINRISGRVLLFLRTVFLRPRLQVREVPLRLKVRELPQKWRVTLLTLNESYRKGERYELPVEFTVGRAGVTLPTSGVTATWRLLQDGATMATGAAMVEYLTGAIRVSALVDLAISGKCFLEYIVSGLGDEVRKPLLSLNVSE
jgi:hypothetical protein